MIAKRGGHRMLFKNDHLALMNSRNISVNLADVKLPNGNDVYFRAKQSEIVELYCAARIFMDLTETTDWDNWFSIADNISEDNKKNAQHYFENTYRSYFYETALFYYNSIVNISWTMCYVAAEYSCHQEGKRVDINAIKSIDEAAILLRKAEKCVTNPTSENNPFEYLMKTYPQFEPIIQRVISFWNSFSVSEIRKNYNYCKHRGHPLYEEIAKCTTNRFFSVRRIDKKTGNYIEVATNGNDVRYCYSLDEAIENLKQFDDDVLFPYVSNLILEIEKVIKPSPLTGN